jgi:sugar/nucleoside kinase (ribokinase family)
MGDASKAPVPSEYLGRADWVHIGTGDPEYLLRIAAAARKGGAHLAVDPAQEIHYRWDRSRFRRLLSNAELFFGNESEIGRAVTLLGLRDRESLLAHVPMVIETRGSDGAVALTRRGSESVKAHAPRRLRQVTGAGDAFRGGFYAGWFAGEPLRICLGAGTRAAAGWIQGDHSVPAAGGPGR